MSELPKKRKLSERANRPFPTQPARVTPLLLAAAELTSLASGSGGTFSPAAAAEISFYGELGELHLKP
jgi:hypothetical protein